VEAPPAAEAEEKPVAEPKPVKKSKHHFGNLDVNALMEEIKEEESNNQSAAADSLSLEQVKAAWEQYAKQECTQESVKVVLNNSVLALEEQELKVTVTSNLAENTIRQERALINYLREQLQAPQLLMSLHIDKSKAAEPPPKPRRLMSSKEKYLEMRETNPLLQEMQKRFDLRPDE